MIEHAGFGLQLHPARIVISWGTPLLVPFPPLLAPGGKLFHPRSLLPDWEIHRRHPPRLTGEAGH